MQSFEEQNQLHGYHVLENTSWANLKAGNRVTVMTETDKSSLNVVPYACVIEIKHRYFNA